MSGLSVDDLNPGRGVRRVLLLHRTDRWYVGDFLRHAAWLGWLAEHLPGAQVDLATHAAYLPLYADGRFGLADVARIEQAALGGFDLVVEPTSFPSGEPVPAQAPRLLRTWDRGWSLFEHGRQVHAGDKNELNYFRAAHPTSLGLPAGSLGAGDGTAMKFAPCERADAARLLRQVAPDGVPVVVYNPTASNPFTRQTRAVKEVDNTLTVAAHVALAQGIAGSLPGHRLVVAAPVKPGDEANTRIVERVAAAVGCVPVTASLREFAALLADPRVCATMGGGTGSNTHLAALVGTWGLSVERGADAVMRANWARAAEFQMGSFRWRNPSARTAVHVASWRTPGPGGTAVADVAGAVSAFLTHHAIAHGDIDSLFERHRAHATPMHCWSGATSADARLGQVLTGWMTSAARVHLGDFTDELAYLRHRHPSLPDSCGRDDLASLLAATARPSVPDHDPRDDDCGPRVLEGQLFEDSNPDKLVRILTRSGAGTPSARLVGAAS